MANPDQLAVLKQGAHLWNIWRKAHPYVRVDFSRVTLNGIDFDFAMVHEGIDLTDADFSGAYLINADFSGAHLNRANLTDADFSGAHLSFAHFNDADLTNANLTHTHLIGADFTGADFTGADFTGADLTSAKGFHPPQSSQSRSTTDWLSMVETYGNNLLVMTATIASIIQGLDVLERRWREKKEKQQKQIAQASSASSTQPAASSSSKPSDIEKEITEIQLVMDDGSHHSFTRWISDPDELLTYIDAFSDPTCKTRPLQVTFMKRVGRALVVNITEGGKDNPQLNVILGYLKADPQ